MCVAELVLHAASAIVGLPFAAGRAQLLAAQPAAIVSVAPFKGQFEAASAIVKTRIGVGLSVAGRYADGDEGRVLWAGLGQWFVAGNHGLAAELLGLLAGKAAVSDDVFGNGKATASEETLTFFGPDLKQQLHVLLILPKQRTGPVPCIK